MLAGVLARRDLIGGGDAARDNFAAAGGWDSDNFAAPAAADTAGAAVADEGLPAAELSALQPRLSAGLADGDGVGAIAPEDCSVPMRIARVVGSSSRPKPSFRRG